MSGASCLIFGQPAGDHNYRRRRNQRILADCRPSLIIAGVSRRLFTPQLRPGTHSLIETEAHHARDVLRLAVGESITLFDSAGHTADAAIRSVSRKQVEVEVDQISKPPPWPKVSVFCALPKGERADWMIEKLSELGVATFIPLQTERGVVETPGENKVQRWNRIAIESAKQSERIGVMTIEPSMKLIAAIPQSRSASMKLLLTTQGTSKSIVERFVEPRNSADGSAGDSPSTTPASLALFIGPEGGWTDAELKAMLTGGLTPTRLTGTILRIETAAVAAAAVVMSFLERDSKTEHS